MPRVRDLLYRFRPAGAPGAASSAGVPADRTAELSAELEPLLACLAETDRACAEIVEQGRVDAEAIRYRDAERARAVVTAAGQRADAERAAAAAQVRQSAEAESAADRVAAEHEAAELRERARRRMPACVDDVIGSVRGLIGAAGAHPSGEPERV